MNSDVEVEATSPAAHGSVHVVVTIPGGTSPATRDDVFAYDPEPLRCAQAT